MRSRATVDMRRESTDSGAGQRELILISDLQTGANLEALQGMEWPDGVQVKLHTLEPALTGNAGFQPLPDQPFTPGAQRDQTGPVFAFIQPIAELSLRHEYRGLYIHMPPNYS